MRKLLLLLLFVPLLSFAFHKNQDNIITLQATTGLPGQMLLTWTSNNPALSYLLERSFNGKDFIPIAIISPGSYAYMDFQLGYYLLYWYRIAAHDPTTGETIYSNVKSARSKAGVPIPFPNFTDSFNATNINTNAWKFTAGKWVQKNGMLQQINTNQFVDDKKALLSTQTWPDNQMIVAKVKVTNWSTNGDRRVGVGVNTNEAGNGYQFVFHGTNTVQFLADHIRWGDSFYFPWNVNKWYWIRLWSSSATNQLFAKIWLDGTQEPSNWMFQQNGWYDFRGGVPALNGGSEFNDSYAEASFDAVSVFAPIEKPLPFALNANHLQVTTFAKGLNYPHSMQELADGSILVSTSNPMMPGGNYFVSNGVLLRFVDLNNDGVADGPGKVMYSGIPGPLTGLQAIDDLIFVTSSRQQQEAIYILRQGNKISDPYTLLGSIKFTFPTNAWSHRTYSLLVRRMKGPGKYQLFFNVGSQFNDKPDSQAVNLSGLISGVAQGSSIYSVDIQDTGTAVIVTNLTQIANGLRNAAGMAFDPKLGDLYLEDNGMDLAANQEEPVSADVLYRIPANQIGQKILDFGFPNSYIAYRSGIQMGLPSEKALVAFQPLPDGYTGSESEGISEIAFAPLTFPDELSNGLFAGFHGRFNLGGIANEENPLVFYNRNTGNYFHMISNDEPNVGHLDGLLSTCAALYVSDISSTGELSTSVGNGKGVIYKIQTTKPLLNVCRK